jgi:hypothetical protein
MKEAARSVAMVGGLAALALLTLGSGAPTGVDPRTAPLLTMADGPAPSAAWLGAPEGEPASPEGPERMDDPAKRCCSSDWCVKQADACRGACNVQYPFPPSDNYKANMACQKNCTETLLPRCFACCSSPCSGNSSKYCWGV